MNATLAAPNQYDMGQLGGISMPRWLVEKICKHYHMTARLDGTDWRLDLAVPTS